MKGLQSRVLLRPHSTSHQPDIHYENTVVSIETVRLACGVESMFTV